MVVKSDLHYSFIDGGPLEDSLFLPRPPMKPFILMVLTPAVAPTAATFNPTRRRLCSRLVFRRTPNVEMERISGREAKS